MSKIIFLNGISSSGKTSIVKAIQHLAPIPFLHIGVDTMIDMMPAQYLSFGNKSREGCYFEIGKNEYGRTISCNVGYYGSRVFKAGVEIIKTLVYNYLDLIVDEVIWDLNRMNDYLIALQSHEVIFVKVYCSRKSAQEREILRSDREIGLANHQYDQLQLMKWQYDVEVDTDAISSFEAARMILQKINML